MTAARLRPGLRQIGPTVILSLVLAFALLWLIQRPAGAMGASYLGQMFGAEAVLLLSTGLVLISSLPWMDAWFDGIDHAAIWHRNVSIAGLLLLVPHVVLAANPHSTAIGPPLGIIGFAGMAALVTWALLPRWRSVTPAPLREVIHELRTWAVAEQVRRVLGGYDRWRLVHRTAGVFVAAGFLHGLLDATPFAKAAALRWSYVTVGGIGLVCYVYRELLARRFALLHDYQVAAVRQIGPGLVEIALTPLDRRFTFVPGQFVMVYLEAKDGWHRHPFTIASAPHEDALRFTIKALGDYTSRLSALVAPGMPAVIGGPHGRFNHSKGTDRQIWIAGGVGVTPFLSWLRSLDTHKTQGSVDFFYISPEADKPYAEEITAIAQRHPELQLHLINSRIDGRLTSERVLAALPNDVAGDRSRLSVFLCGPADMVRTLRLQFRSAGIARGRIHREYFDWR